MKRTRRKKLNAPTTLYPREHATWRRMKDRCGNKNCPMFYRYGGRGISVCQDWQRSFSAFFLEVGPRPSPQHSLDRIDTNGNYEPGNVRWATAAVQANNRQDNVRVKYRDNVMSLAEAIRAGGNVVIYGTAWRRIKQDGWSIEEAVETPPVLLRRAGGMK